MSIINDRIRTLMAKHPAITPAMLARELDISVSAVSHYMVGSRQPTRQAVVAMAKLFKCSADYLLGLDKRKVEEVPTEGAEVKP